MTEHIIIIGAGPACYVTGLEASDMEARVTLVGAPMTWGAPTWTGAVSVHAHLTLAEALQEAAEDALGQALHKPRT